MGIIGQSYLHLVNSQLHCEFKHKQGRTIPAINVGPPDVHINLQYKTRTEVLGKWLRTAWPTKHKYIYICISEPSWFYNFHVCAVVHGNLNFSSLIIPSSLSLYLFLSAVFCLLAHWFKVSFFTLFAILQTNCYFVLLGKSNFCVFYFN